MKWRVLIGAVLTLVGRAVPEGIGVGVEAKPGDGEMIGLVDHVVALDPVVEWVSSKLSLADRLVLLDE